MTKVYRSRHRSCSLLLWLAVSGVSAFQVPGLHQPTVIKNGKIRADNNFVTSPLWMSTEDVATKNQTTPTLLFSGASDEEDSGSSMSLQSLQQSDQSKIFTMLGLIFFVASLSALDRSSMSVALVPMAKEMSYTDTTKGEISSFFSLGYGLGIIPCGLLLPYASPRFVMAVGVLLWSAGTIATPLAAAQSQMVFLLICRALVGASESVVIPTVQKLYANWIPPEKKSLSVAILFAGFQSGTILSYVLSPLLLDQFDDWRSLFYIYGGLGLLFILPWSVLAQDRPSSPDLKNQQLTSQPSTPLPTKSANIDVSAETASFDFKDVSKVFTGAPWGEFVRSKGVWAMVLAHAANNWGLYNNLSWAPTFYSEQYGLNVKESALLLIVPSLAGAAGGFLAGAVADNIIQNMETKSDEAVTTVRRVFQGVGLLGAATCLATLASHIPEEPVVAQCLLSGSVAFQSFNAAGYGAANQEKAGEKWTGLLYSVTSLPAVMFGTLGVYTTGRILDATNQDWGYVFGLNAGVFALGAIAFTCLYDSKREFD